MKYTNSWIKTSYESMKFLGMTLLASNIKININGEKGSG